MQGAGETGQAEAYMNSRIKRSPTAKPAAAEYLGMQHCQVAQNLALTFAPSGLPHRSMLLHANYAVVNLQVIFETPELQANSLRTPLMAVLYW